MKKVILVATIFGLGLGLGLMACGKKADAPAVDAAKLETHSSTGVIKEVKSEGKILVIDHAEFPGWMGAMVMPFEVRDLGVTKGFKAGDKVAFSVTMDANGAFVSAMTSAGK